ncbi:hypothetical protein ACFLTE_05015 [Bacteroidota bacterium]
MRQKLFCILLFLILFLCHDLIAQWTPGPGNQDTLTLSLLSGGYVSFKYTSIDAVENGITYTNWTNFNLYFDDEDNDDQVKLTCYANTANLDGEQSNTMALSQIEVRAICSGCSGDVTQTSWQTLTTSPGVDLLTGIEGSVGGGSLNYNIYIDYRCGNSGLINQPNDYYYVDIIFDVE